LGDEWVANIINKNMPINIDIKRELIEQIKRLREASKNAAVLVEGKKDKYALDAFKINNIYTISAPLFKIVEDIAANFDSCILLLDLDKAGNKLFKKLKEDLQKNGVKINTKFRTFLFKKTGLKEIEGLISFINHLTTRNSLKK